MAKADDLRIPRTRIRAGALAAALKDVASVAGARDTVPILAHVMVTAADGRIELQATNLDLWVTRDLASDDAGQADSAAWTKASRGFALTLPAALLAAAVNEFDKDAMVVLTGPQGDETRATVSAGRARFRLPCLPVDDFPLPPPAETLTQFTMACTALGDALAAVEHAISSEETRYYLNGVYLHPEGLDLRAVATDGHRLARLAFDAPDGGASLPATIVPRVAVAVLDKLLVGAAKTASDNGPPPTVEVAAEGGTGEYGQARRLRFDLPAADGGTVTLLTKSVDGQFPAYERIIPAAPAGRAVVDRAELAAAVKRVAVLAETKTRAVKCRFAADLLELSVTTPELGEAREELPCSHAAEGEGLTIGFDARYLREALLALASDSVAFGLPADGMGPVLVRAVDPQTGEDSDRLVQVIMPVRV